MVNGAFKIATAYGDFWIHPNEIVGRTLQEGKFWDEFLLPEFDAVEPGRAVVDVGAFIGQFSIYAAKRGCVVHAFEPNPINYELLIENIKMNGVEHLVTAYNIALFDNETMMRVHVSSNMTSGFAVVPDSCGTVYATTLDSYQFRDVALIKIDAQACDLAVMRGARLLIASQHPVICYEIEMSGIELHLQTEADYHHFIEDIGYTDVYAGESDYVARPKGVLHG